MIKKTCDLNLDMFSKYTTHTDYVLVQGDIGSNEFVINLQHKKEPMDLTSTTTTITFKKFDGNKVVGSPSITNVIQGVIKYEVGEQEVAYAGKVEATVEVHDNQGNRLTSGVFSFEVREQFNDGTAIESTTEYPFLAHLMSAGAEELNRVSNENTRKSAETTRVTSESGRNSAESTRVTQENTRKTAETSRATAETGRTTAETTRVSSENTRGTNETNRTNTESSRATAETGRASAESIRISQESSRLTAETSRGTAESTRVTQENTRNSNESARGTAESARSTAETARQTAETTRGSQESTRLSSEATRATSEATRVSQEGTRATQETARINAEGDSTKGRVKAENLRVTAESGRVSAESTRVTQESTRGTNETARQSAETTRTTQETSRVNAEGNISSGRVKAENDRASAESTRTTSESTRVSNEATRVLSENTRITQETARVSAEGNASSGRVKAENDRVSAESSRATSESGRVAVESARASSESTRGTNETARVSAESSRATAETARVTADSARTTSENARKTAETGRVNAESARVTTESSRVSAENTRVSSETARGTNETNRQSAETTRQTQETARQTNTNSAIGRLDSAVNTTALVWKPAVATYANIVTAYPSPQFGWRVETNDTKRVYRYDGSVWVHVSDGGLGYEAENKASKGVANGYAPLDASNKVPATHLPSLDYIPTSQKGAVNGVASLGADGKVPSAQLPPLDYAGSVHTHTKVQITDFPTSMPANGGNSSTVNGMTVLTAVPAGAIFTDTIYTHPATHTPATIVQDASNRFTTDTEKATWNAKASTAIATTIANGLMALADKVKLDGVATGANNYTHPTTHTPATIVQDASNRFVTDTEKTTWNAKGSSNLVIGGTSVTAHRGDYGTIAYNHSQTSHVPFSTVTHITPATANWYRIATSALNIGANSSLVKVDFSGVGVKGSVLFRASCHDGVAVGTNLSQLGYTSSVLTLGITKIRIVYNTTATANYAYVEVYNTTALAITCVVELLNTTGWSVLPTVTVGAIPAGYTSEELVLDSGIVTNEDIIAGKQLKSLITTGTPPIVVSSTTVIPNLNASLLNGLASTAFATSAQGTLATNATPNTHIGTGGASHANATTAVSGFMIATDKVKLDGIATGANNYVHPATHTPATIVQDASNRFVTDTEKSTWSNKANVATTLIGYGITDGVTYGEHLALSNMVQESYSPLVHEHTIAETTGLQTALNAKANLASPTFTGTVSGVTKAMVGLSAVDNTADSAKPVSTAQATAIGLKANIASPTFTGTATSPTFNATSTVGGGFQGIDADTALVPSFTWSADLDTGIWRTTTDSIGFTTGGVNRATINSTGLALVGTATWSGGGSANANTAYTHSQATHAPTNAVANQTLTSGNGMATWTATSGNLTIALGTPASISGSTTNSLTATSHTHDITLTASDVGASASSHNHDGRYVEIVDMARGVTGTIGNATWVAVSYGKTFSAIPAVVATGSGSVTGDSFAKIRSRSTTGFEIIVGGNGVSNTFSWIAII